MPCARPSEIELNSCASLFPYSQSTSRRLGPMPPPARPPWQPEQFICTNSCRPAPMAPRSFAYGFDRSLRVVGGPGTGPTDVRMGGGAELAARSPGVLVHEAIARDTAAAA